jgi:hypothetical protein
MHDLYAYCQRYSAVVDEERVSFKKPIEGGKRFVFLVGLQIGRMLTVKEHFMESNVMKLRLDPSGGAAGCMTGGWMPSGGTKNHEIC